MTAFLHKAHTHTRGYVRYIIFYLWILNLFMHADGISYIINEMLVKLVIWRWSRSAEAQHRPLLACEKALTWLYFFMRGRTPPPTPCLDMHGKLYPVTDQEDVTFIVFFILYNFQATLRSLLFRFWHVAFSCWNPYGHDKAFMYGRYKIYGLSAPLCMLEHSKQSTTFRRSAS